MDISLEVRRKARELDVDPDLLLEELKETDLSLNVQEKVSTEFTPTLDGGFQADSQQQDAIEPRKLDKAIEKAAKNLDKLDTDKKKAVPDVKEDKPEAEEEESQEDEKDLVTDKEKEDGVATLEPTKLNVAQNGVDEQIETIQARKVQKELDLEKGEILGTELNDALDLSERIAEGEEAQQEVLQEALSASGLQTAQIQDILTLMPKLLKSNITRLAYLRNQQAKFLGPQTGSNGIVRNLILGWGGDPFADRITNANEAIDESLKGLTQIGAARDIIIKIAKEDNPLFAQLRGDNIRYEALAKNAELKSKLLANADSESSLDALVTGFRSRFPAITQDLTDQEVLAHAKEDARVKAVAQEDRKIAADEESTRVSEDNNIRSNNASIEVARERTVTAKVNSSGRVSVAKINERSEAASQAATTARFNTTQAANKEARKAVSSGDHTKIVTKAAAVVGRLEVSGVPVPATLQGLADGNITISNSGEPNTLTQGDYTTLITVLDAEAKLALKTGDKGSEEAKAAQEAREALSNELTGIPSAFDDTSLPEVHFNADGSIAGYGTVNKVETLKKLNGTFAFNPEDAARLAAIDASITASTSKYNNNRGRYPTRDSYYNRAVGGKEDMTNSSGDTSNVVIDGHEALSALARNPKTNNLEAFMLSEVESGSSIAEAAYSVSKYLTAASSQTNQGKINFLVGRFNEPVTYKPPKISFVAGQPDSRTLTQEDLKNIYRAYSTSTKGGIRRLELQRER